MKVHVQLYTFSIHILYILIECSHLKPLSEGTEISYFFQVIWQLYV